MTGKTGLAHFPIGIKMEAIRLFFEERRTQAEIQEALGLRNKRNVARWVRQYRRDGEAAFLQGSGRPRKVQTEARRIQQLEMENALLKKYHTELRKSLLAKRNIGSSGTTEGNTK
jgi:transposase-like protein